MKVSKKRVIKKKRISTKAISRTYKKTGKTKKGTRAKVPDSTRTGMVGVIVPLCDSIFATVYLTKVMAGIEQACAEAGFGLLIFPHVKDLNGNVDYRKLFNERRADGILVIAPPKFDLEMLPEIRKSTPLVLIDAHKVMGKTHPFYYVNGDNTAGARVALEYLIAKGHTNIAHITGTMNTLSGQERFECYKQVLAENGIPFRHELVVKGNFTDEQGYLGIKELFARNVKFTAVFCGNDFTAIGAQQALREANLFVPADISLIGFDDVGIAAYLNPPLTTVRQPALAIGYEAATILLDVIKKKKPKHNFLILPTRFVERGSVRSIL